MITQMISEIGKAAGSGLKTMGKALADNGSQSTPTTAAPAKAGGGGIGQALSGLLGGSDVAPAESTTSAGGGGIANIVGGGSGGGIGNVVSQVVSALSDEDQKENIKPSAWTKIVMYRKAGEK